MQQCREMSHHGHDAAANPHFRLSAHRPATGRIPPEARIWWRTSGENLSRYRSVTVAQR